ncbi:MAG TPA: response regulator [Gemmatimonadales bacterium]|jgi:DNA-binding response OmpR family regulator|nr:response regulator [Gemmatimonadales bacterium]
MTTILFVEDDAAIRSAILRVLEASGYAVLPAATPMEAIELAAGYRESIHVLLTDIGLLGLTGPQLARLLLADRPGLRVLYISGQAEADMLPGRVGAGTAFLQKPFSMEALLQQLGELLGRDRGSSGVAANG